MPDSFQKCTLCGKLIFRDFKRMNENKKRGWKIFCSQKCLSQSRVTRKEFVCSRQGCDKSFTRCPVDLKKSKVFYCSHRCAAIVSNRIHPRNMGVTKVCAFCNKNFKSREKYCSRKCKDLGESITAKDLISQMKDFVKQNGRIPFKQEYIHSHAARLRFGSWNKAIEAAGFAPNPVMFAKKYIAKDGDKCDSLAEKIIDDFLSKRNVKHIRNFPYPGNEDFTVDFKVGDFWVEFFGLSGGLKRYDELKERKLRLAKRYKLKIIEIYPKDIFPLNKKRILPLEFLIG
jgi:hypothetical protein